MKQLVFKNYYGSEHKEVVDMVEDSTVSRPIPYPNWTTWSPLDDEWHYIIEEEGKSLRAECGSVFPAKDVIYRIENGKSEFKLDWPE